MTAQRRKVGVALPLLQLLVAIVMSFESAVEDDEFAPFKLKSKPDLDLEDWRKEGFAFDHRRRPDFEALGQGDLVAESAFQLTRVHVVHTTPSDFRSVYEPLHQPIVIDGIPEIEGWGAAGWTISLLSQKFPTMSVMVGVEEDGSPVQMTMKEFERYARTNTDDTPMYVFDWRVYEDEEVGQKAMAEYRVPSLFEEDLFQLVAAEHRDYPGYRWLLVGPERSGSACHNDPLGTSAWNTLLSGRKLWFLAPPHLEDAVTATQDENIAKWFVEEVPKLRARFGDEITLYVQHPGETIFVPGFWMHAVLNLDDTTAVTQNFVSSHNFPEAWEYTRLYLPRFAKDWLQQLELHRPDLAMVARRIDAESRGGEGHGHKDWGSDHDDGGEL